MLAAPAKLRGEDSEKVRRISSSLVSPHAEGGVSQAAASVEDCSV